MLTNRQAASFITSEQLDNIRQVLSAYERLLHDADFMKQKARDVLSAVPYDQQVIRASDLDLVHLVLSDFQRRQNECELAIPTNLTDALKSVETDAIGRGIELTPKIMSEEDVMIHGAT